MFCAPSGSELAVRLAVPEERFALPSDVPPDEKLMLPVGVPEAVPAPGVTLAVSTTGVPSIGVEGLTLRLVAVGISEGVVVGLLLLPQPVSKLVSESVPGRNATTERHMPRRRGIPLL